MAGDSFQMKKNKTKYFPPVYIASNDEANSE